MGGAKSHFDATTVDPSEYEPQVVELSEQLIQDMSPNEDESRKIGRRQEDSNLEGGEREDKDKPADGPTKDSSSGAASKNARWLSKLQKLRQQFVTPPTD